ncbi:enoyl-CoA hydratase/isomerase family protein [Burkholderia cenocepacia]|uniref:enoyl-CoA hydratase/isomerase family protein n=1 Tax=Burkholderia cenocepacia TaxID=95486 RepID=UPI002AB679C9|nr:enoyl-CoA hydratase/isomerase family protein [Burkholderia cenocepacia]
MEYTAIELRRENRVAWLTLSRPEALNALSPDMLDEIAHALETVTGDGDTRVLVVTGAGRAFCAGADLKGVGASTAEGDGPLGFLANVHRVFESVRTLPMPVIAAVNGLAMGGGLELAMHCDIVVAAESAKLADAHANFGVIPGCGGAALLPRLIGPAYARYLLFSGDSVPAAELYRIGFIAKLFAPGALVTGTQALAERIAEKSPLGLRITKRIVAEGLEQADLAGALKLELEANVEYGKSYDMNEGMAAFAQRRKPQFRGC